MAFDHDFVGIWDDYDLLWLCPPLNSMVKSDFGSRNFLDASVLSVPSVVTEAES